MQTFGTVAGVRKPAAWDAPAGRVLASLEATGVPVAERRYGPGEPVYGEGMMLLEDEQSGESRIVPLLPQSAVYVPGSTTHRTINTGEVLLTYRGNIPKI